GPGDRQRPRDLRARGDLGARGRPRGLRRGHGASGRPPRDPCRIGVAAAQAGGRAGRVEGPARSRRGGGAGALCERARDGAGGHRGRGPVRRLAPPPPARRAQGGADAARAAATPGDGEEAPARVPPALKPGTSHRRRYRSARMGLVYAIANQKGGVGKTTTAVNIAASAARAGRQVLLCDLDQQCNATAALGFGRDARPSTYDCLCGEASLASAAKPAGPDNLWLVPASRDLAGAAVELPRMTGYERRLREALGPVRERFALTLLDCPPSLGPVTINALAAADRAIVPVQAEYLALEGLVQFLETLEAVRR